MLKKQIIIGVITLEIVILIIIIYTRFIIPLLISNPLMHDIASDYIGAQALLDHNEELYPELAPAFERIGISWGAYHRSTHPPTAYLLVLPFTPFAYPLAQLLWMIVMLAFIVLSFRVFNLTWIMSILACLLSLFWPPTIWSIGQLTPIWLLGLALAYHYRNFPLISGINIAIASLPKFLAVPSLLYHFWRRKWSVVIGFVSVWLVSLGVVLFLRPDAISSYLTSNRDNSLEQILRTDNSALMVSAWRLLGWVGFLVIFFFILYVAWVGLTSEDLYGWACLVWVGIALLPIAWNYSIFPLLPWLIKTVQSPCFLSRFLAIIALLLPYLAPIPTFNPWAITLSIFLSGISFTIASVSNKSDNKISFIHLFIGRVFY